MDSPKPSGRPGLLVGSLFLGVDNGDDPKGARLDDHDPVAHEEIMVSAPSGINLHYPRRQHNDPDRSRYDRAGGQREIDVRHPRRVALADDRLTNLGTLLGRNSCRRAWCACTWRG